MKFDIKRIRNNSMVGLVRPVSTFRHSGVIIKKKKIYISMKFKLQYCAGSIFCQELFEGCWYIQIISIKKK